MKTITEIANIIDKMRDAIAPHLSKSGGAGVAVCPVCQQNTLKFDIIIGVDLFGCREIKHQLFLCKSPNRCGGLTGR